jgi:hypothetical protein
MGGSRRLSVVADGRGLVGHAGAVVLRQCADQTGLTSAFCGALRRRGFVPGWDRGVVRVHLAAAIVLGATSLSDIAVLAHHAAVLGDPPSDSTVRRALAEIDHESAAKLARARAKVRAHVWALIGARPGGFPWLQVAGKILTGWIVIDLDATIIESTSAKQGAAGMGCPPGCRHRVSCGYGYQYSAIFCVGEVLPVSGLVVGRREVVGSGVPAAMVVPGDPPEDLPTSVARVVEPSCLQVV